MEHISDEAHAAESWFDLAAQRSPDTPSLVVSEVRIRRNIEDAAVRVRAAGKQIRPHAKTHKMLEVARLQAAAGACGLQAAKVSEATALLGSGVSTWMISYPIVGEQKWKALRDLATQVELRMVVDSMDVANGISEALKGVCDVEIMIEIETGLHRVGVSASEAGHLAGSVNALPGLSVVGVMTHEGHIGPHARKDNAQASDLTAHAVAEMQIARDGLRAAGIEDAIISMGSTPTFQYLLDHIEVDEVRPGIYVFLDMNSVSAGAGRLDHVAAAVVATVVSRSPRRNEFVIDAGSKSLSSDRRTLPDGSISLGYVPSAGGHVIRASEEHGIVATQQSIPQVGERVTVVPNHICPVVNLFDEAVVIDESSDVITKWAVAARGRVR